MFSMQSISPGLVRTEIMDNAHLQTFSSKDAFTRNPYMESQDIADAVIFVIGAPQRVQVFPVKSDLLRIF